MDAPERLDEPERKKPRGKVRDRPDDDDFAFSAAARAATRARALSPAFPQFGPAGSGLPAGICARQLYKAILASGILGATKDQLRRRKVWAKWVAKMADELLAEDIEYERNNAAQEKETDDAREHD